MELSFFLATYLSTLGHIPLIKLFICVSAMLQRHNLYMRIGHAATL